MNVWEVAMYAGGAVGICGVLATAAGLSKAAVPALAGFLAFAAGAMGKQPGAEAACLPAVRCMGPVELFLTASLLLLVGVVLWAVALMFEDFAKDTRR